MQGIQNSQSKPCSLRLSHGSLSSAQHKSSSSLRSHHVNWRAAASFRRVGHAHYQGGFSTAPHYPAGGSLVRHRSTFTLSDQLSSYSGIDSNLRLGTAEQAQFTLRAYPGKYVFELSMSIAKPPTPEVLSLKLSGGCDVMTCINSGFCVLENPA